MDKPKLEQRYPLTLDYYEVDEYLKAKGLPPFESEDYSFWSEYLCHHELCGHYTITDPNWAPDQQTKQIIETLFREFPECVEERHRDRRLNFYGPHW